MKIDEIFKALVQFHFEYNLIESLPSLSYGRFRNKKRQSYDEGKDNNEDTKGMLILCRTEGGLVDMLCENKLLEEDEICDTEGNRDYHNIKGYRGLKKYILDQSDADGAYLFEEDGSRILRAGMIANGPPGAGRIGEIIQRCLPQDFISYDGSVELNPRNLGTKTKLALKYMQAFPAIEAFQIKKSAYRPERKLGLGKVTHFTYEGLKEEFFFVEACDRTRDFFNREHAIAGMLREYEYENGVMARKEKLIGPSYLA